MFEWDISFVSCQLPVSNEPEQNNSLLARSLQVCLGFELDSVIFFFPSVKSVISACEHCQDVITT